MDDTRRSGVWEAFLRIVLTDILILVGIVIFVVYIVDAGKQRNYRLYVLFFRVQNIVDPERWGGPESRRSSHEWGIDLHDSAREGSVLTYSVNSQVSTNQKGVLHTYRATRSIQSDATMRWFTEVAATIWKHILPDTGC